MSCLTGQPTLCMMHEQSSIPRTQHSPITWPNQKMDVPYGGGWRLEIGFPKKICCFGLQCSSHLLSQDKWVWFLLIENNNENKRAIYRLQHCLISVQLCESCRSKLRTLISRLCLPWLVPVLSIPRHLQGPNTHGPCPCPRFHGPSPCPTDCAYWQL